MRLHGLSGSTVGHRSIALGFKSWLGYVRREFHLWRRTITFGGHLTHLAYLMHKSGCKTATFNSYVVTMLGYLYRNFPGCYWQGCPCEIGIVKQRSELIVVFQWKSKSHSNKKYIIQTILLQVPLPFIISKQPIINVKEKLK